MVYLYHCCLCVFVVFVVKDSHSDILNIKMPITDCHPSKNLPNEIQIQSTTYFTSSLHQETEVVASEEASCKYRVINSFVNET